MKIFRLRPALVDCWFYTCEVPASDKLGIVKQYGRCTQTGPKVEFRAKRERSI